MGVQERRKREKQERRQLILSRAQELFFKHDYEAVTMAQIAIAAELGKGTLYSYFDSKESIYIALYEEGLAILQHSLAAAEADRETALDRLRAQGQAFLRFYFEYPEYFRIMFFLAHGDILAAHQDESKRLMEVGWAIRAGIARIIEQGIGERSIGHCDPIMTADVLWGTMLGLVMVMEMSLHDESIQHNPEMMFLRLAEILTAGLAAPSSLDAILERE